MECIPDTHKFKVIYQRCGKTGVIDLDKTMEENGFILEMGEVMGEEDYWLCLDCYEVCKGFLLKKILKTIEFRMRELKK